MFARCVAYAFLFTIPAAPIPSDDASLRAVRVESAAPGSLGTPFRIAPAFYHDVGDFRVLDAVDRADAFVRVAATPNAALGSRVFVNRARVDAAGNFTALVALSDLEHDLDGVVTIRVVAPDGVAKSDTRVRVNVANRSPAGLRRGEARDPLAGAYGFDGGGLPARTTPTGAFATRQLRRRTAARARVGGRAAPRGGGATGGGGALGDRRAGAASRRRLGGEGGDSVKTSSSSAGRSPRSSPRVRREPLRADLERDRTRVRRRGRSRAVHGHRGSARRSSASTHRRVRRVVRRRGDGAARRRRRAKQLIRAPATKNRRSEPPRRRAGVGQVGPMGLSSVHRRVAKIDAVVSSIVGRRGGLRG